ncbi:hypothetical protein Esti_000341 [Eimeria stiedai]
MKSLCRAAEGKFRVGSVVGGGYGGRNLISCGDSGTIWALGNAARSNFSENRVAGVLHICARGISPADSRSSFFSSSSSSSVSPNPSSLPELLSSAPPPCAECPCKSVCRIPPKRRLDREYGSLVSSLPPLSRCPLGSSTVESCRQPDLIPGGVTGATYLPPSFADALHGVHKQLVQCRNQQPEKSLQLLSGSKNLTSPNPPAYLRGKISAESLTETSSHGFSWRSVGRLKTRSRQGGSRRESARCFPMLAVAFATTLVFPVKEERNVATGSKFEGVIDEGCKSPATRGTGHKRPEYISTCSDLPLPFPLALLMRTEAVVKRAAQVAHDHVRLFESLAVSGTTNEVSGSWGRVSRSVRHSWEDVKECAARSATNLTKRLMPTRPPGKMLSDWGHDDDCEVKEGTYLPLAKKILQGSTRQGQLFAAATENVVCQPAKRQKQESVRSGAETQHLPQQVGEVRREQSEVPSISASWFAARSKKLGVFFRIFVSVCQRLLFVVPLAFAAATAGFWLVMVPYISAGLRLVGVDNNRVLWWDSAAQRELREVMFTAITAAASAAGPTYVKFLQWVATRPDLFPESLCSRCAKLQTAVRPFSYPRAAFLLREQFGEEVAKYLILDPSPIGCGCIAQVYRAYLLLSGGKNTDPRRRFLQHAFVLGEDESTPISLSAQTGEGSIPVAVAVKVMRPGVRESMEFDLRMMLILASAVQWLPAFGFVAIKKSVEEFGVAMRRQLDFSLEEKHIKKFRANFGLPSPRVPDDLLPLHNKFKRVSHSHSPDLSPREVNAQRQHGSILGMLPLKSLGMRRQVAFPYPFEALNSGEVLVMTLEEGFTLNQLFKAQNGLQEAEQRTFQMGGFRGSTALAKAARRSQASPDLARLPSAVAESLIQRFSNIGMICLHSFLQMVFLDNFFHGDMHSGNLLCRYARSSPEFLRATCWSPTSSQKSSDLCLFEGQLELVVLDCGLAGSLSQADRVNFVTLLEAIGMKRGRDAAIAMLRRARRSACKDEAKFCSEVEKLINEHHFEEGNSMQMRRVKFTSLMGRMLSLSKEYSVELDPSFVSLVVAMSILEGVGAQLCPDTDVLKAAMPYSFVAAKLLRLALSRDG